MVNVKVISDGIFIVHSELQGISIQGKDAYAFAGILDKLRQLQFMLAESNKETEDSKDEHYPS